MESKPTNSRSDPISKSVFIAFANWNPNSISLQAATPYLSAYDLKAKRRFGGAMEDKHRQSKRKLEEENSVKEGDGVDDSHNNVRNMQEEEDGYSSDDYIVTYAGGLKMSREHRKEYLRQINESDGFDITLDLELGKALGGPVVPIRNDYYKPNCIEFSRTAINKFNNENAQNYEFVEIVNVNAQKAAGIWYYITFNAMAAEDSDDTVKTFQALVWEGLNEDPDVRFCRLKKSSSHEGDKKSPDSDVGTQ